MVKLKKRSLVKDVDIYNSINQPQQVKSGSTVKHKFAYLADGRKLHSISDPANDGGLAYIGSSVFKIYRGKYDGFESTSFSAGRIVRNSSFAVQYHITDHLGSVRAVLNQSMTVLEQNDYYPFGLRHPNASLKTTANRYRYNGKEEIAADATSDYGARQYSAEFCQWLQEDPLAEKYYSWSPYNFCANNPIRYIDPSGMVIEDPDEVVKRQKMQLNENLLFVQNALRSEGLSEGMSAALNKLARAFQSSLNEISTLEKSDQVYLVHYEEGNESGMSYNNKSGTINIGIGKNDASKGVIGHELKHAYQYEKGQISLVTDNTGYGKLYDITDETAAYNRERTFEFGFMFFQTPNVVENGYPMRMSDNDVRSFGNSVIPPAYQTLPNGPIDINSKAGKVLRQQTIEAGRSGTPVKEVYKGWQKDYFKGQKK